MFGGRILAILVKAFYDTFLNRDHRKTRDLDELIKEQERILKSRMKYGSVTNIQTSSPNKKKSKYFSETEELYIKAKEKSQPIEDIDKVLKLFDNAKWGQGDLYNHFLQQLKLKFGVDFELLSLSQVITKFLREDYFVKTNHTLPSFKNIEKAILSKVFLTKFFHESTHGNGPLMQKLSHRFKYSSKAIVMASHYEFLELKGEKKDSLIERVIQVGGDPNYLKRFPDIQVSDILDSVIPLPDKSGYLGPDYFSKRIQKSAEIFHGLTPLPQVKTKADACKVLGITENASVEEIKKAYKTIAKTRHPDVMAGKGLPESVEKKLSQNFSIIQKAYDLLKSKK